MKRGMMLNYIGISTSGGAKNVAAAVMTANSLGLHTIGLTGKDGGKGDVMRKEGKLKFIQPGESVTYEVTVSLYEK